MKARMIGAVLLLTLLGGCASSGTAWVFDKPGTTEAQLKRDRELCFAEAIETENVNRAGFGFRINRDAYKACMEARCYRVRLAAATPETGR
jgi:hypothetical protein